jgi:hypothetical protein
MGGIVMDLVCTDIFNMYVMYVLGKAELGGRKWGI